MLLIPLYIFNYDLNEQEDDDDDEDGDGDKVLGAGKMKEEKRKKSYSFAASKVFYSTVSSLLDPRYSLIYSTLFFSLPTTQHLLLLAYVCVSVCVCRIRSRRFLSFL